MAAAGVPVVPGSPGTLADEAEVRAIADEDRLSDHAEGCGRRRRQGHALVEKEKELGLGDALGCAARRNRPSATAASTSRNS